MRKYPRTQHIEGSRLQSGDEDLQAIPFSELAGRNLVVEEKLDGANAGISFSADGQLRLQSRGHLLRGGQRERQFELFKAWAEVHRAALYERLEDRFLLYGEWLYAQHTIFYDALPHYFLEFDVLDTRSGIFLSTATRRQLLRGLPTVSVPVLFAGVVQSRRELERLIGPSRFKSSSWREQLGRLCVERSLLPEQVWRETDDSDLMEGLYIKVENEDGVIVRAKYVRASFTASVARSGDHWMDRPFVPNLLQSGVDLFEVDS